MAAKGNSGGVLSALETSSLYPSCIHTAALAARAHYSSAGRATGEPGKGPRRGSEVRLSATCERVAVTKLNT